MRSLLLFSVISISLFYSQRTAAQIGQPDDHNCFEFDGKDDRIVVQNPSWQNSNNLAVSIWVNVANDENYMEIMGYYGQSDNSNIPVNKSWRIYLDHGVPVFRYYRGYTFSGLSLKVLSDRVSADSKYKLKPGQWYNLVVIASDKTVNIYLNGSLIHSESLSTAMSFATNATYSGKMAPILVLGAYTRIIISGGKTYYDIQYDNNTSYGQFVGKLDELKVWQNFGSIQKGLELISQSMLCKDGYAKPQLYLPMDDSLFSTTYGVSYTQGTNGTAGTLGMLGIMGRYFRSNQGYAYSKDFVPSLKKSSVKRFKTGLTAVNSVDIMANDNLLVTTKNNTVKSANNYGFLFAERNDNYSGTTNDNLPSSGNLEHRWKSEYRIFNNHIGVWEVGFKLSAQGAEDDYIKSQGHYELMVRDTITAVYRIANYESVENYMHNGELFALYTVNAKDLPENCLLTLGRYKDDFNGVLWLDGREAVCITDSVALLSANNYSIHSWVKITGTDYQPIFTQGNLANTKPSIHCGFDLNANKLIVAFGSTEYEFEYKGDIGEKWFHLTLAIDNLNKRIETFVNGHSLGDTTITSAYGTSDAFYIGARNKLSAYRFLKGEIDEFAITKGLWGTEEILAQMASRNTNNANNIYYNKFDWIANSNSGDVQIPNHAYAGVKSVLHKNAANIVSSDIRLYGVPNVTTLLGGKTMVFNGSNNYISSSDDYINLGANFTIEGWFNPSNGNSNSSLIEYSNNWQLKLVNGKPAFIITDRDGNIVKEIKTEVEVAADTWTHIALSNKDTLLVLYVNGVPEATATNSVHTNLTGGDFYIGCSNQKKNLFKGEMDEIKFYSKAKNLIEINRELGLVSTGLESKLEFAMGFDIYGLLARNKTLSGAKPIVSGTQATQNDANWISFRQKAIMYKDDKLPVAVMGFEITNNDFIVDENDFITIGVTGLDGLKDGSVTDLESSHSWYLVMNDDGNNYNKDIEFKLTPSAFGVNLSDHLTDRLFLVYKKTLTDNGQLVPVVSLSKNDTIDVRFLVLNENVKPGCYSLGFSAPTQGMALRFDKTTTEIKEKEWGEIYKQATLTDPESVSFSFWAKPPVNPTTDILLAGFRTSSLTEGSAYLYVKKGTNEIHFGGRNANDSKAKLFTFKVGTFEKNKWINIGFGLNYLGGGDRKILVTKNGDEIFQDTIHRLHNMFYNGVSMTSGFHVGYTLQGEDSLLIDEVKVWADFKDANFFKNSFTTQSAVNDKKLIAYFDFDAIGVNTYERAVSGGTDILVTEALHKNQWVKSNWYLQSIPKVVTQGQVQNESGGLRITGQSAIANYIASANDSIAFSYSGKAEIQNSVNAAYSKVLNRTWQLDISNNHNARFLLDFNTSLLQPEALNKQVTYFLLYSKNNFDSFACQIVEGVNVVEESGTDYIRFIANASQLKSGFYTLGWSNDWYDRAIMIDSKSKKFSNSSVDASALTDITIEAWVKPLGTGSSRAIMNIGNLEVLINNNDYFRLKNGSDSVFYNKTALVKNTWYHLAATVDNSKNVKLYINGNLVQTDKFNSALSFSSTTAFTVGNRHAGGKPAKVVLDELRIFDAVLNASDITAHYKSQLLGNEDHLWFYNRYNEPNNAFQVPDYTQGNYLKGQNFDVNNDWPTATDKYQRDVPSSTKSISYGGSDIVYEGGFELRNRSFLKSKGDKIEIQAFGANALVLNTQKSLPQIHKVMKRYWWIAVTDIDNGGGSIQVNCDFSNAGLSVDLHTDYTYYLLVKDNLDGDYRTVATYNTSVNSATTDDVRFYVDAAKMPTGYYTIGITKRSFGSFVSLDGINDYLQFNESFANVFKGNNPFTIEVLVQPFTSGVIFQSFSNGQSQVELSFTTDGYFSIKRAGKYITSTNKYDNSKFWQVVACYDGSKLSIKVGDSEVSTISNTDKLVYKAPSTATIAGANSNFIRANIDEFRIWNKALPVYVQRVSLLSNKLNNSGLIVNFRFNEINKKVFGQHGDSVITATDHNFLKVQSGLVSGLEYLKDAKEITTLGNKKAQVNELEISSNTGTGNFLNDNADHLEFGFIKNDLTTATDSLPNQIENRYNSLWKMYFNDVSSDGGKLLFTFKQTSNWTGPTSNNTYYILFKEKPGDNFSLVDFEAYEKNVSASQVVFTVDASVLKDGYYALGFAETDSLLVASVKTSDAYIDLHWKVPSYCFNNIGRSPVQIELENDKGIILSSKRIDSIPLVAFYEDSYRDWLDEKKTVDYELNIYKIGKGQSVCKGLFNARGQTDDFRIPTIAQVKNGPFINKNEFEWVNTSNLANKFRITRTDAANNSYVVIVDSINTKYTDSLDQSKTSLVNGDAYKYSFEVFSTRLGKGYTPVDISLRTIAIDFEASDTLLRNNVELSWNSVAAYADEIVIKRDGLYYAVLKGDATTFDDYRPLYGKKHVYDLLLFKESKLILKQTDTGSVKPIGFVAGRAVTFDGSYGLSNVTIKATATISGQTVVRQTTSDSTGYFEVKDVYFGAIDTLKIEAVKSGFTFIKAAIDVALSPETPRVDTLIFKSLQGFNAKNDKDLGITSFTKDNTLKNQTRLKWTLNKGKSKRVFVQVFRKNDWISDSLPAANRLLTIGKDAESYIDSQAVPGVVYEYKVVAYYLIDDDVYAASKTLKVKTSPIAPIVNSEYKVNANNDKGIVELNWTYPDLKYDGFIIKRNGMEIGRTTKKEFVDFDGLNDTTYNYSVQVFKEISGADYFSDARTKQATYPTLQSPTDIALSSDSKTGRTAIRFDFANAETYNFTGFAVYRQFGDTVEPILLETITKKNAFLVYDYSGMYNHKYTYSIRTFKGYNGGKTGFASLSRALVDTQSFTWLPAPVLVAGPTEMDSSIYTYLVQWDAKTTIYTGTEINTGDEIISLKDGTTGTVFSVLPGNGVDKTNKVVLQTYSVKYDELHKDSVKVYSSAITEIITSKDDNIATLTDIKNFKASDTYSNFVLLSWEYPVYVKPDFIIYRDGKLLDTAHYSDRTYIDKSASPNQQHCYLIRAEINNTDFSKFSKAYGKTTESNVVCGLVENTNSSLGIANVKVTIDIKKDDYNIYHNSVKTDAMGFYEFNDVPKWKGIVAVLNANGQNIQEAENKVTLGEETKYVVNFEDDTKVDRQDPSVISSIANFSLTADEVNQAMEIRFAVDGSNYSGIEIYRGSKLLTTVLKGKTNVFVDNTGSPDYTYTYALRTYWAYGSETAYSKFVGGEATYPSLKPTNYFVATADEKINAVSLVWAHPNGQVDAYEITRNGTLLATVTNQNSQFYDYTGIPGQFYKYEIVAVRKTDDKVIKSASQISKVNFPYLPAVAFINSATVVDSTHNAVEFAWQYGIDRIAGFYIYRNGVFVDSIKAKKSKMYRDINGSPNTNTVYGVVPYFKLKGTTYKAPSAKLRITFPKVYAPTEFQAIPKLSEDKVILAWKYPENANVSGFIIERDNNALAVIGANEDFIFEDHTGIPNSSHTYSIYAYVGQKSNRSNAVNVTTTFPKVSAPTALRASRGLYITHIQLDWDSKTGNEYIDGECGYEIEYRQWAWTYEPKVFKLGEAFVSGSQWTSLNNIFEPLTAYSRVTVDEETDMQSRNVVLINSYNEIQKGGQTIYHPEVSGPVEVGCNKYRIRYYRKVGTTNYYSDWVETSNPGYTKIIPGEEKYSPTNFLATKGTTVGSIKLTWENGTEPADKEILRRTFDGNFISLTTVDQNVKSYTDASVVAGLKYVYVIRPIVSIPKIYDFLTQAFNGDTEVGWSKPEGNITGSAITKENGIGIPGANVVATATINGQLYVSTAITDASGNFKMGSLCYGDGVKYNVQISYQDHVFENNNMEAELNDDFKTVNLSPFVDLEAFTVEGKVTYKGCNCPLDSVKIVLEEQYAGNRYVRKTAYTQADGTYRFVYNPFKPNLKAIIVYPSDTTVWTNRPGKDTSFYQFAKPASSGPNLSHLATNTKINFEEITTLKVKLYVATACNPIPGNNRFSINIMSKSGCMNKDTITNNGGIVELVLPPVDFEASITGVSPLNTINYPYVQALSSVVKKLYLQQELLNIQRNPTLRADGSRYYFQPDNEMLEEGFIFHKEPHISVFGMSDYCGGNPSEAAVITAGSPVTLTFRVEEQHLTKCAVSEGFLLIKNGALIDGRSDTVLLNDNNKFQSYRFVPNNPNPTAPFKRYIIVEYHTKDAGFQAETIVPVYVLGKANIPGQDVRVNPSKGGKGDVPVPLFVLRDPPGDGSYSYIEEGTSFTTKLGFGYSTITGGGGDLEVKIENGPDLNFSASFDKGKDNNYELNITSSLTKTISTSDAEDLLAKNADRYLIGNYADIIVGAGLVSSYGLSWEITQDKGSTCKIKRSKVTASGITGINTTWIYTVDQIKGFIIEDSLTLMRLYADPESEKSEGETAAEYALRLETAIYNWKQVLKYHQVNTLPYYRICSDKAPFNIPKEYRELFDIAKNNAFCAEIGYWKGDEFKLTGGKVEWTQALFNAYNGIMTMGYHWEDDNNLFSQFLNGFEKQLKSGNPTKLLAEPTFLTDQNVMNWGTKYSSYFVPHAKNITFSGGTSFDESLSVSKGSDSTFSSKISFAIAGKIGMTFGGEVSIDPPATGGPSPLITKTSIATSREIHHNVSIVNSNGASTENAATIGYHLSDNDAGDQFSVHIIRGIDPNHTPYFETFGGRSSCPYEYFTDEGDDVRTISRDQYEISLEDRNEVGGNSAQHYLEPDELAHFVLKLANNSPFGEGRSFGLTQVTNSNAYGATITAQGHALGMVEFFIDGGTYVYIDVYVKRAPGVFVHDDIELMMYPICDGTVDLKPIALEASWLHPCTDVSITTAGNWVINKAYGDMPERVMLVLGDYDINNEGLQNITMEYRKQGKDEWTRFSPVVQVVDAKDTTKVIDKSIYRIPRDSLLNYYNRFKPSKNILSPATYPLFWDITNDNSITDGVYEIRARYTCQNVGQILYSNIVHGEVDRSSFTLIGAPSPADGVLSIGEDVVARYNQDIDFENPATKFTCYLKGDATKTDLGFDVVVYKNNFNVIISEAERTAYHGKEIVVRIDSLYNKKGNNHKEPVEWSFEVSNNPVFWNPAKLSLNAYKGTVLKNHARLDFASFSKPLTFTLTEDIPWLELEQTTGTIAATGVVVDFKVKTKLLDIASYQGEVTCAIDGYEDIILPIDLTVSDKKPYWKVDADKYSQSMYVVANFQFKGSSKTSTNVMDIIAVFIDEELRGYANITKLDDDKYAAYVKVYGNAADKDKKLSFRIWVADEAALFNGTYTGNRVDGITFRSDAIIHSAADPAILEIAKATDLYEIVPLKAGNNWFSHNLTDNGVNKILKTLTKYNGITIKNHDESMSKEGSFVNNKYVWTGNLTSISPGQGYILTLPGGPDTLYLYGQRAGAGTINLKKGWNNIGITSTESLPIGDVSITDLSDGDLLVGDDKFSVYNGSDDVWEGSLSALQPFKSYKIKLGTSAKYSYKKAPQPEEWQVNPAAYEYSMLITGRLMFSNVTSIDTNDLVGAFIDGELRGVGKVSYLPKLGKYRTVVMVFSDKNEAEKVSFKLYDYDLEMLYDAYDHVNFEADKLIGNLSEPFIFSENVSTAVKLYRFTQIDMQVVPNPFAHQAKVQFTDLRSTNYELVIRSSIGTELYRQKIRSFAGPNEIVIDFDAIGISDGVYFINLEGNNQFGAVKVVKQ